MARVQLALNVSDIDAAVEFYGKLFGVEPAKRRPGYANFAIADPPLKLVLIESPEGRGEGAAMALNHLGVEVSSTKEVQLAADRLSKAGLETALEEATNCCYAWQDKVWSSDPDGAPWEIYTVLGDVAAEDAEQESCCTDSPALFSETSRRSPSAPQPDRAATEVAG